jgi:hypothetical protein
MVVVLLRTAPSVICHRICSPHDRPLVCKLVRAPFPNSGHLRPADIMMCTMGCAGQDALCVSNASNGSVSVCDAPPSLLTGSTFWFAALIDQCQAVKVAW